MVYRFKPSEREITNSALFKNFSISLNIYHGSFFFFFFFFLYFRSRSHIYQLDRHYYLNTIHGR